MTLTAEPATAYQRAATTILEGGAYAPLPLPPSARWRVPRIVEGLKAFDREIPRAEQARWEINVPRNPDFPEADDGVIRRSDPEKPSDQKLMLHARPELIELLRARDVSVEGRWEQWLLSAVRLRNQLFAATRALAHCMDQECPELRMGERLEEAERGSLTAVLRANLYDVGDRGAAKPHVDRNALTIHVMQSCPGLYFVENGEPKLAPEPPDGCGYVFPGVKLHGENDGRVKASVHGAYASTLPEPRSVIVFFAYLAS